MPIISDNNDLGNVAIDATGCLPVSDRDPSKLEKDSVPYDLNFSIMCLLRNHNSEPVDKAGLSMCADVNPDDDHGFSEDKGPRNFNFSNGSSNLHSTSTLVKPTPIRPTGGFCTGEFRSKKCTLCSTILSCFIVGFTVNAKCIHVMVQWMIGKRSIKHI